MFLFSLFVLGRSDWSAAYIFAGGNGCYQDAGSTIPSYPLEFVATSLSTACANIACFSVGQFSFLTTCTTTQPAIPDGMVAWGEYTGTTSCSGSPSIITAYTTGCTTLPGLTAGTSESFQLTCDSSRKLHYAEWLSNGGCPSSPAASVAVSYGFGCASVNANGVKAAIQQIGCHNGGVSINWFNIFKTWASYATWTVAAFDVAVYNFFKTNGAWTYDFSVTDPVVSVDVTFTGGVNDTAVLNFVDTACSQMLQTILNGICANAVSGTQCTANPTPLQKHTCSYTVTATAKRGNQQQTSGITISQSFAQQSSGMMARPSFIVMLVALLSYFLKH